MACDPIVSIVSLTKVYRGYGVKHCALRNVSLDIFPGDSLGLVGRNGAGKTTLLSCVLGFLRPTSGNIRVFGASPDDPRSRSSVGYLSEDNRLYSSYSVDQILGLVSELRSVRLSPADKRLLLEDVGLEGVERARVGRLSKGMRQRLGIALANIGEPKLLVMDEPLTGLDPVSRQMTLDLVRRFRRQGRTVVFCSHLLDDVAKVCSRVCVLHLGEVTLDGTTDPLAAGTDGWNSRVLSAMGW